MYDKLLSVILLLLFSLKAFALEEGTLTVITDPTGVEVWLDDKYLGDSPIENKKLKAGKYLLKLIDPIQQVSSSEEIYLQTDKPTIVEKSLKTKFGILKVESDPSGADVCIYTDLGKTPLTNNFVIPGKYIIEVKHPKKRYIPVKENILLPAGKQVTITNTLMKKSLFDTKAFIRIMLGAGTVGSYIFALVEHGYCNKNRTAADYVPSPDKEALLDMANTNAIWRTIGIVTGSLCIVGLEIVAFY